MTQCPSNSWWLLSCFVVRFLHFNPKKHEIKTFHTLTLLQIIWIRYSDMCSTFICVKGRCPKSSCTFINIRHTDLWSGPHSIRLCALSPAWKKPTQMRTVNAPFRCLTLRNVVMSCCQRLCHIIIGMRAKLQCWDWRQSTGQIWGQMVWGCDGSPEHKQLVSS